MGGRVLWVTDLRLSGRDVSKVASARGQSWWCVQVVVEGGSMIQSYDARGSIDTEVGAGGMSLWLCTPRSDDFGTDPSSLTLPQEVQPSPAGLACRPDDLIHHR